MLFFPSSSQREFEQVVRAYSSELFRFAYWLSRDRFVADELVQECFARAWRSWDQLADRSRPKPWLISILRREHARLYERKRFDYVDEAPEALELPAMHDHASDLEVDDLLASLPLSLREPFLLQALGGYSCAEIAAEMELSEGAVMVRLSRARKFLQDALQLPARNPIRKTP